MKDALTLNVIIKDDKNDTVIISSKEKGNVLAVYNCKTAQQVADAVEQYIRDKNWILNGGCRIWRRIRNVVNDKVRVLLKSINEYIKHA